ncbi:MAG TPA: LamG-like jellyroll fold domain-containing protein [Chthoniobacteraceae bacterium]|jgi:hypothetical protein|nr:LamG-like jellyroll fold domain-containing protein [Chthoniobacteraceae bacterium]
MNLSATEVDFPGDPCARRFRIPVARHGAWIAVALALAPSWGVAKDAPDLSAQTAQEITAEATRPQSPEAGRALPLAAHWCVTPFGGAGFSPDYELKLIREGHHVMLGFGWPATETTFNHNWKPSEATDPQRRLQEELERRERREKYYQAQKAEFEPAIREAARLNLPFAFLGTQWESSLSYEDKYYNLPEEQNPNVVTTDGQVQRSVSPFGPIKPWQEVGKEWIDSPLLREIQQLYPQPPLVVLISNNEAGKLAWTDIEKCKYYLTKYGPGRDDDFKRKVISDGMIERYRSMLDSMRAALGNATWRKNVRFWGYEAGPGPIHLGRWPGWKTYSLYTPGRLDPEPLIWDGTSPSFYTWEWMPDHDFTLWSPQIEAQNWVFMLEQIHETKPDYWFELSTWDSDQPGHPNDSRRYYLKQGQDYGPWRYEGFVQLGMWLTVPRSVREFRGWTDVVPRSGEYFMAVVDSVDRIYANATLQKFWRYGRLVANPAQTHPYNYDVPKEYQEVARWFMLSTNLDTQKPWKVSGWDNADYDEKDVVFPVFSIARVINEKPKRQWLVYAHSPLQARNHVQITVPEYGDIDVSVSQSGSFFLLTEGSKTVQTVLPGGPASVAPEVSSTFPAAGETVRFSAKDPFTPRGPLEDFVWDFGDGSIARGEKATHAYPTPGQYAVTLKAGKAPATVERRLAIFPGLKEEPNLVCRLLMTGALDYPVKDQEPYPTPDHAPLLMIPDAAGHWNTGFLSGGRFVPDPQRQTVLELSGDRTYVFLPSSREINEHRKFGRRTVSLWFKPKETAPRQAIYAEGGPGGGFNLWLKDGQLHAGTWATGIWPGTWLHSGAVEPGVWHHAALILDNDTDTLQADAFTLWLDGARIGAGPAARVPGHGGTLIGRAASTRYDDGVAKGTDNFAGRISDFRIYNRALGGEEIEKEK